MHWDFAIKLNSFPYEKFKSCMLTTEFRVPPRNIGADKQNQFWSENLIYTHD